MVRRINLSNLKRDGASNGNVIKSNGTTTVWGNLSAAGPKITSVAITDSSYNVIDDTAVALTGGYIKITGSDFVSGCLVVVDTSSATSTTFVNSTEIRAQLPAKSAGSYVLYVTNPDGSTGIRVAGVTYSSDPSWVTSSTQEFSSGFAISLQLSATSDSNVVYSLANGSSLPANVSLASNGLLSGTATVSDDTVYSFTINADDVQNQTSPRTFNVTITKGDDYFKYVSLLLAGNGSNNVTSNTFIDSSNNNFTFTRVGNPVQGSFSPFCRPDGYWAVKLESANDRAYTPTSSQYTLANNNFTYEGWVFAESIAQSYPRCFGLGTYYNNINSFGLLLKDADVSNKITAYWSDGTLGRKLVSSTDMPLNQWVHLAITRNAGNVALFLNGSRIASNTISAPIGSGDNYAFIGSTDNGSEGFVGFISNVRLVVGNSIYDPTQSTITVPTSSLTAVANTKMLTAQSSRIKDNSSNNAIFTFAGTTLPGTTAFGPLSTGQEYSANSYGASIYFDGTDDYIYVPGNSAFSIATTTTPFTWEAWLYPTANGGAIVAEEYPGGGNVDFAINMTSGSISETSGRTPGFGYYAGGWVAAAVANTTLALNQWNHLACVFTGSTSRVYIDGVDRTGGTPATTWGLTGSGGSNYLIGRRWDTAATPYFKGFISDLRFVKGQAVYTSNFTPPAAPLASTSNTQLLCNFKNAGIFNSAALNHIETVGNATIRTDIKKYGSGSLFFDGTDDRLVIQSNRDFNFGTGDWTVEFWIYPLAYGGSIAGAQIFGTINGSTSGYSINLGQDQNSFRIISNARGSWADDLQVDAGEGPALNTWTHMAVSRSGGTINIFKNGELVKTGTGFSAYNYSGTVGVVGRFNEGSTLRDFNGYIDDLRVTKGYARYTANFTPPVELKRK